MATHPLTVLVFSETGRKGDRFQLVYVVALLAGDIEAGSPFHLQSWCSHKCRRHVRSIDAADILAAGESIDNGKVLISTLSSIYSRRTPLTLALDSRDRLTSLSTQRNYVDKSIRSDLNVILHAFDRGSVSKIVWISDQANLSDPDTKSYSPLNDALRLMIHDGAIPFSFPSAESSFSYRPLS